MRFGTIINYFKSSDNVGARALRGGFWVAVGNSSEQGMRLLRNMILTRILAPEAFGLMAIVLTVNGLFNAMTEIGIKEAIIQNPRGQEKTYLNGTWWFSFVRGIFLYLVLFSISPFVADFYENPEMTLLFRIAFLSILFISLFSPVSSVAMKKLEYFKWAVFFNGGGFIGISCSLIMSIFYPNVWALVIGFTIENFSRMLLSYILFPFFPTFQFDADDFKALLKFASGMFGLPILTIIFLKTDIVVVGKICTMSELGLYSMAANVAWVPFQFITMISTKIMMPVFSEKQKDKQWINTWNYRSVSIIFYISTPLLCFVSLYGRELLSAVYGPQYGAVAIPFAIIFAVALLRTCSVPMAALYLSIGHPELHRLFAIIRVIIILSLIVPMTMYFGLIGAASSAFIAMAVSYVIQVKKMSAITHAEIKPYFGLFFKALFVSCPVIILSIPFKLIDIQSLYVNMIPGIAGCVLTYAIIARYLLRNTALRQSIMIKPPKEVRNG